MAQKRKGHGGNGVGALQDTSVRAQPSLTNYQLTLLHGSEGGRGGQGAVGVAGLTIWAEESENAKFRCELS